MQRFFYVEGPTERVLLRKVLEVNWRIEEFNPWLHCLDGRLRQINSRKRGTKEKVEIFLIYDADLAAQTNTKLLLQNLEKLVDLGYLTALIQQTGHLEDELVRCCSKLKNLSDLYSHFQVEGAKEFKANFCRISNPAQKLQDAGFDPAKLWRGELIEALEGYRAYHKTVDYLLKQRK